MTTQTTYNEGDFVQFYCVDDDCLYIGLIHEQSDYATGPAYGVTELYSGNGYFLTDPADIKRHATLDELKAAAVCSTYHDIQARIAELTGDDQSKRILAITNRLANRETKGVWQWDGLDAISSTESEDAVAVDLYTADAVFIIHAANDIEWLLAQLEAKR